MGIHVGPPKHSLNAKFERNPVGFVRVTAKCVYSKDGRQAAICNDIKNLFDVHNPQTIADLGASWCKVF